jgi:hypothetical protein
MNAPLPTSDWLALNRQALARNLAALRRCPQGGDAADGLDPLAIPALARIAELFRLSHFETEILLLCAAHELDGAVPAPGAAAQATDLGPYPSFGLALSLFADGHWSALSPGAPLRYWHLVELDPNEAVSAGRLRISEAVLHHLVGIGELDERLDGLLRPVRSADAVVPAHGGALRDMERLWTAARAQDGALPAIELIGQDLADLEAAAAAFCARLGVRVFALSAAELPTTSETLVPLLRRVQRDLLLTDACLLVETDRDIDRLATIVERIDRGPIVITRTPFRGWSERRPHTVALPAANDADRARVWGEAVDGLPLPRSALEQAMGQFHLPPRAVHSLAQRLRAEAEAGEEPAELGERLWRMCRIEAAGGLTDLAEPVAVRAGWDDLVLPEPQLALLRNLVVQLRQRAKVYEEWGFAARSARGLGITALFAGPSGTGKTMAGEIIAGERELDLWRIDLSRVVSKWIGETEKNLARVFEAADPGGAVLLFDEADALFGKRSEVKDSHDRYANLEISYLLQRMENYRGLAILTTNNEEALDPAFLRRLRTIVQFPFPDAKLRERIWQRIFPPQTPTEGLRSDKLARLQFSGGTIRNVALTAAFLAAEAGKPVGMAQLKQAAEIEGLKMKRPLAAVETQDWLEP